MKKTLSILLAVVFCLTLFPLAAAADETVKITYKFSDSYGDGWNWAAISISEEGSSKELYLLTLENGNEKTGEFELTVGHTYVFKWNSGSYDSECSYEFKNGNEVILSGSGNEINGFKYKPAPVPSEVTVTLDPKGGTLSEADTSLTVKPGDTYGELPIPKREGYTFDGWFTEEYKIENDVVAEKDGLSPYNYYIRVSPLSSWQIYNGFKAGNIVDFDISVNNTEFTGKADINDFELPSGFTVSADGHRITGKIEITSEMIANGHTFLDADCKEQPTDYTINCFRVLTSSDTKVEAGKPVTKEENHTLYAGWSKIVPVTITFASSNDGTGETKTVQTTPGEYTLPPCDFTAPTGKQFKAWLVGNEEKQPGDKITVGSDLTVTAVWEDIPAQAETFTVTFDTSVYGEAPPEQKVVSGEKAEKPENPVPFDSKLTFGGWRIVGENGEEDYDFTKLVEKDITLHAVWYVPTSPSYVTASWSTEIKRVELTYNDTPDVTVYETDAVISWTVIQEATSTSSGKILYKGTAEGRDGIEFTEEWIEIIPPLSGSSDWIRKSLAMGAALFNPPKKQTGSRLPEPEKQPDPVIVTVDAETPAIADEPAEPEIPFVDAAPGDPYYTAIVYAFKSGLMKGVSDTEFGPSVTLNRAMFVTILGRLDQIDPADYADCPFEDCEPLGDWDYLPYVAWAAEKGIVLGFGDGTFRPFDPVTNEQAVLMLRRYADYLGRETVAPEIAYEGASPWASAAVAWAFADGIYPTETEAPFTSPAERGWTARAFYNLVGFLMK